MEAIVYQKIQSNYCRFSNVPQNLFLAIVETNKTKKIMINCIKSLKVKSVGIYRLQMKKILITLENLQFMMF